MARFRFLRLALAMNFPPVRLKAWHKHAPCDEYTCDVCNPKVGSGMILW